MSPRSAFIDERYDPLIVTVMPARFEADELEVFLNRHAVLLARGRRYSTITDVSRVAGLPPATTRKRIAEWNQQAEPAMRRWTVGTAIVAPSSVLRGALTALNWLAPPPYPQAIVSDMASAVAALEDIHRKLGEPVPDGLKRFRDDLVPRRSAV